MNIKMQVEDRFTQSLTLELFGKPHIWENLGEVVLWKYQGFGPKTVAVYSLPSESMYFATKIGSKANPNSQRAETTTFKKADFFPKRGEMMKYGESAKNWNKAARAVLTPKELWDADGFLVVNQAVKINQLDHKTLAGHIVEMARIQLPRGTGERAGAVAYTQLPYERLVTPDNFNVGEAEFVWYGTSGAYNMAELLLTLATAYKLGLNARFDNYGSAEEVHYGQRSMQILVQELQYAVGIPIVVGFTDTASAILEKYQGSTTSLANALNRTLKHPTRLLYHPQAGEVKTDNRKWLEVNGYKSIAQLHREGATFGGAAIYRLFYAQAQYQRFVALLYDGSKGGVHIQAAPYMQNPYGLWICPVGSFAIRPYGKNGPTAVEDPGQFLQKVKKTAAVRSTLRQLWDLALERTPLAPEKVGTTVVVEVKDNGSIKVSS